MIENKTVKLKAMTINAIITGAYLVNRSRNFILVYLYKYTITFYIGDNTQNRTLRRSFYMLTTLHTEGHLI